MFDRLEAGFQQRGYGVWCVERLDNGAFVGFVGLNLVQQRVPVAGSVELAWRLMRAQWGKGFATEAAGAAMRFGFETVGCSELVAYTATSNTRSRRVMERIGMQHDPAADFNHPSLPEDDPLRPHVVYRAYPVSDSNR